MNRRDFIRRTALASFTGAFISPSLLKFPESGTGLILYTVRDEMAKDPDKTLKAVADLGYNWIEAANYTNGMFYNMKPSVFRGKVEHLGMKLLSTHSGVDPSNIEKAAADAAEAGMKYLILPSLPGNWNRSTEGYMEAADFFNLAGNKCKAAGIRFGFHNHWREFRKRGQTIPYDILLNNTDPELVIFELDLCWITASGQSAAAYINKFPGRFELWHMKDMSADKKDATMGEGIIDFKPVFGLAEKSGLKYFFVEQDSCKTHTPLESARISREFILKNFMPE
jgi:sugar phosphate isomerase/epimerase